MIIIFPIYAHRFPLSKIPTIYTNRLFGYFKKQKIKTLIFIDVNESTPTQRTLVAVYNFCSIDTVWRFQGFYNSIFRKA